MKYFSQTPAQIDLDNFIPQKLLSTQLHRITSYAKVSDSSGLNLTNLLVKNIH